MTIFINKEKIMKKILIALAFVSMANSAAATVINFNDLEDLIGSDFGSYSNDGYTFRTSNIDSDSLASFGSSFPRYAGSAGMYISYFNESVTLARPDSQLFNFTSIDLASFDEIQTPSTFNLTFTGTFANNTTIAQTFVVPNTNTFSTFNFSGFNNLKSVSWSQGAPNSAEIHQFDNLVLNLSSNVAAVPEPETYTMFLAGLGLMGFVSRRRKAA